MNTRNSARATSTSSTSNNAQREIGEGNNSPDPTFIRSPMSPNEGANLTNSVSRHIHMNEVKHLEIPLKKENLKIVREYVINMLSQDENFDAFGAIFKVSATNKSSEKYKAVNAWLRSRQVDARIIEIFNNLDSKGLPALLKFLMEDFKDGDLIPNTLSNWQKIKGLVDKVTTDFDVVQSPNTLDIFIQKLAMLPLEAIPAEEQKSIVTAALKSWDDRTPKSKVLTQLIFFIRKGGGDPVDLEEFQQKIYSFMNFYRTCCISALEVDYCYDFNNNKKQKNQNNSSLSLQSSKDSNKRQLDTDADEGKGKVKKQKSFE